MFLFLTLFTFAPADNPVIRDTSDKLLITETIRLFVESGDERDLIKSNQSLHKDFSQYLDWMGNGVSRSTKDDYESLLKAGKIGGEKRAFNIKSIEINESIAYAHVEIDSPKLIFSDMITLMKEKGTWKIVSLTLHVKTK